MNETINAFTAFFNQEFTQGQKVVLIPAVVIVIHLIVILIRRIGHKIIASSNKPSLSKVRTLISVAISALVFSLYLIAVGFVLIQLGVPLKVYLASASIIGLAVGFGSQGLVQDVVNGLTLVLSDLFDIDDMVEISGKTGIVKKVGMRFTVIVSDTGAKVYIPNRTIKNVVNYPAGYEGYLLDLRQTAAVDKETLSRIVAQQLPEFEAQFGGLTIGRTEIQANRGIKHKNYVRVLFKIWPGKEQPICSSFKQTLLNEIRKIDADYQDWMISTTSELEAYEQVLAQRVH